MDSGAIVTGSSPSPPSRPPPQVEVTFVIDEAGALTVRATEAASGATAELVVPGGDTRLSHAEIDRSVGAARGPARESTPRSYILSE